MKRLFLLMVFLAASIQADAAKMSSYTENTTPNDDVYFIGVDPNDTTQTANGSNYRYSLSSILGSGLLNFNVNSFTVSGTGDSWFELKNNTSFTDSLTGKYGIRFYNGVFQQILNGTATNIGSASIQELASDPAYTDLDTGEMAVSTASGDLFIKTATGLYTIAGTYAADPTTPTLTSLTIPTSGDTATAVFSEAVSYGAGGAGGWTLNSPTNAMTYASGTGTDTIVFNLASTILSTDTPTVSYTQPTNGFESADNGVDLASIPNASVTNNSTQTGGADVTPVAKYSFESGALAVDSAGTNTLSIVGAPTSDTALFKELLASLKLTSSPGYFYIADASLSSDFPLKSGTTNTSFSFTFWINQDSRGANAYPIAKYAHTTNERSLAVKIDQTTGALSLLQGHTSGTGSEASLAATAITLDRWYHVGVTYDGSTNGYKIRVWDDYNNTQLANVTGSFANSISLTGAKWMVNGYNDVQDGFDGHIDNLEFFGSVLSDAEIDARR